MSPARHILQLLPQHGTHGVHQLLLIVEPAHRAADIRRPLSGRDRFQQLGGFPLVGVVQIERQAEPGLFFHTGSQPYAA